MTGPPGPPGATGATGPPGTLGLVTLRQASLAAGRAQSGDLLTLTADCDPGETVIAGGVVPTIATATPQDIARIHLLVSGPVATGTGTGWLGASTLTQTLSRDASLTYTVYAFCLSS
jgi:hypothetical protein